MVGVHSIEEAHVKVNVEVQRAAETRDQRDRAGVGGLVRKACLLDQVRGDGALDDAEHLFHERRPSGEQKPNGKGKRSTH